MFNSYNPQMNIDRINNEIRQLENLKNSFQQMPQQNTQQPIQNIINTGNTPQIDFEARMVEENEQPSEILVQRKTAFIDLKNAKLTIKEINGNMTNYEIVIPKTPEQIENERLKKKLDEMERMLNELTNDTTNNENEKSNDGIVRTSKSSTKKSNE